MRRHRSILIGTASVAAAASLAVAGCGGDDDSEAASSAQTTAATTPAAAKVAVTMGKPQEYSLGATPAQVAVGPVTFAVVNQGKLLHEMVVVPSAGGAAALKQPDGTASEKGSPGEVPDVPPGGDGTLTVTLPAGKYVLLCNLPGHFAAKMYTTFVVQ